MVSPLHCIWCFLFLFECGTGIELALALSSAQPTLCIAHCLLAFFNRGISWWSHKSVTRKLSARQIPHTLFFGRAIERVSARTARPTGQRHEAWKSNIMANWRRQRSASIASGKTRTPKIMSERFTLYFLSVLTGRRSLQVQVKFFPGRYSLMIKSNRFFVFSYFHDFLLQFFLVSCH